jgi:hypothetical protein
MGRVREDAHVGAVSATITSAHRCQIPGIIPSARTYVRFTRKLRTRLRCLSSIGLDECMMVVARWDSHLRTRSATSAAGDASACNIGRCTRGVRSNRTGCLGASPDRGLVSGYGRLSTSRRARIARLRDAINVMQISAGPLTATVRTIP